MISIQDNLFRRTLGLVMLSVNQVEAINKHEYYRRIPIMPIISAHSPLSLYRAHGKSGLTAIAGIIGVGRTIPSFSPSLNPFA